MWLPKGGQNGNGHIRISSLTYREQREKIINFFTCLFVCLLVYVLYVSLYFIKIRKKHKSKITHPLFLSLSLSLYLFFFLPGERGCDFCGERFCWFSFFAKSIRLIEFWLNHANPRRGGWGRMQRVSSRRDKGRGAFKFKSPSQSGREKKRWKKFLLSFPNVNFWNLDGHCSSKGEKLASSMAEVEGKENLRMMYA